MSQHKPRIVLIVMLMTGLLSAMSAQAQCTVSNLITANLVLSPVQDSQSNTAFTARCDQPYNISFRSLHLQNTQGLSYLQNRQSQLRTQMTLSGAVSNEWLTPQLQAANSDHQYIVVVRLLDAVGVMTLAGEYTDYIYADISY